MKNKRGISGVITIILLVLISITAVSIIYIIVKGIISDSKENVEQEVTCLTEVNLEITSSCYSVEDSQLRFIVSNRNDVNYKPDFFILRIKRIGEDVKAMPTPSNLELGAMETKELFINIDYPDGIEEAVFIPKIKENGKECYAQGISFKPVEC